MKKILLAGATGSLGVLVAKTLKNEGYTLRALARQPAKLSSLSLDEVVHADLTDPASLKNVCENIDAVISCAGASMKVGNFSDKKPFYDVDYQGNLHLLNEQAQINFAMSSTLTHTRSLSRHFKHQS
jgi:uncharacterized protein YbjT (DUF2867 family)